MLLRVLAPHPARRPARGLTLTCSTKPVQYEAGQCTCQQYIGPQPLSQIYAEDLTDLA